LWPVNLEALSLCGCGVSPAGIGATPLLDGSVANETGVAAALLPPQFKSGRDSGQLRFSQLCGHVCAVASCDFAAIFVAETPTRI
jgi:hypothetical protein